MFTGIVECPGQILDKTVKSGCLWKITAPFKNDLKIGESVNISGACHTVTDLGANFFEVFSSKETLATTCFEQIKSGNFVNLERSLALGNRLDGHLVYGHVDGTAELLKIDKSINSTLFTFSLREDWVKYVITKGSVSIDGVSLTIHQKNNSFFQVMIIPHTLKNTTFENLIVGQKVNIELDVVGKYLENFSLAQNK